GDGRLDSGRLGLARYVDHAGDVLVRRVRAAADQRARELVREAFAGDLVLQLRDRPGAVGRVRSRDVGLQRGQVELEDLVVGRSLVRPQEVRVLLGQRG